MFHNHHKIVNRTMSKQPATESLEISFVEIRPPPSNQPKLPDRIQVYIARVQPQQCGPLIQDLQRQFGTRANGIGHLKRVRNCKQPILATDPSPPRPTKKSKTIDHTLEVVLGVVDDNNGNDYTPLLTKYSSTLETKWLPGRPAESKEELEEFNKMWPTVYFHKQTLEHRERELELTTAEVKAMQEGMQHAIDDAIRARRETWTGASNNGTSWLAGAVIMDPKNGNVVATACDERKEQQSSGDTIPDWIDPLCTSVLLAVQGVSRKERAAAVGYGMDSDAFQKGQYLCTGYVERTMLSMDVFCMRSHRSLFLILIVVTICIQHESPVYSRQWL